MRAAIAGVVAAFFFAMGSSAHGFVAAQGGEAEEQAQSGDTCQEETIAQFTFDCLGRVVRVYVTEEDVVWYRYAGTSNTRVAIRKNGGVWEPLPKFIAANPDDGFWGPMDPGWGGGGGSGSNPGGGGNPGSGSGFQNPFDWISAPCTRNSCEFAAQTMGAFCAGVAYFDPPLGAVCAGITYGFWLGCINVCTAP